MTGLASKTPPASVTRATWRMSEDWLAVVVGLILFVLSLGTLLSIFLAAAETALTRISVPTAHTLAQTAGQKASGRSTDHR